MKIHKGWSYYLLLLLFPVVFLLHNVNENFGINEWSDIGYLLIVYLVTSFCLAMVSKLIIGRYSKAFVFCFILLVINFIFGAFRDFAKAWHFPAILTSYKYLLPFIFLLLVLMAIYLRKSAKTFSKLSQAIAVFLLVNVVVETGWYLYNSLTRADLKNSHSDYYHNVIKNIQPVLSAQKPTVFWIVFDEYSNSSTLKKVWNFSNPLDSTLKAKGFFVPDYPRSNYNFTHFSVSSTLNMAYLKGLSNHTIINFRDRRREAVSIHDNNTVEVFQKNGYSINNFSIFQLRNHPAQGINAFGFSTRDMINFQTFAVRVSNDIGWNFSTMFRPQKHRLDSLAVIKSMQNLDTSYKNFTARCLSAIRNGAVDNTPKFYLMHFLTTHEPFIYNPDGSVDFKHGYHDSAKHYISQLQYANTIITTLADSIQANYRKKDVVIILQGDHGFKFLQDDPVYDQESCKILYAVYTTDGNYSNWPQSLSSVNGFRILFNKYFQAGLPLLPDSSCNLNEH